MSGGGNDNYFTRWSRRKLAARLNETHVASEMEVAPDKIAAGVETDPSPLRPDPANLRAAEAELAEPAEPLPRIEDLTAESDLTAFLAKEVPKVLQNAALRKMWSMDPNIRTYIGPSEYAWDFNQPGSMAGFGPLDPKKAVVDFLSKTAQALEADGEPIAAAQPPDALSEQPESAPPDNLADADAQEVAPVAEAPASPPPAAGPDATEARDEGHATAQLSRQAADFSGDFSLPRHGGALPR